MKFPYGKILCIPISVFFALIKAVMSVSNGRCWLASAGHMSQDVILRAPGSRPFKYESSRTAFRQEISEMSCLLCQAPTGINRCFCRPGWPGRSFLPSWRIINSVSLHKTYKRYKLYNYGLLGEKWKFLHRKLRD